MLLAGLDALPKDERRTAGIKVLRNTVEYHLEEEEDDLFRNAEGVLDGEQRKIMGNLLSAAKERHLASLTR
ncbi:MAG: hypothetical protein U0411_14105 [Thermodesulfovibrionales bacterium]